MTESKPSNKGRQATAPCGFVVTAASECPAECTAAPIGGIVDVLPDRFSCRNPPSATPSTRQTRTASGITTVMQTNRVTVTGGGTAKTTSSTRQDPMAQSSSSPGLVEASNQSTTPTTTDPSRASSLTEAFASSSSTPSSPDLAAKHSKDFAQTTGGILTITFLTLGILAAIILGIVFRRRRQQRRQLQNTKTNEEGEPMAELSSTRYKSGTPPPQEEGVSGKDQLKSADKQLPETPQAPISTSYEDPRNTIANSPPRAAPAIPATERSGFSTGTTFVPNTHFRPASSVYPEDQTELKEHDPNPFEEQGDLPTRTAPEVSGGVSMAQKQREWEAQGGYGIPEVPAHLIRRPKETLSELVDRESAQLKANETDTNVPTKLPKRQYYRREPQPFMEQLNRMAEREESRTDRWDPNMPRGPPPIPERSARRPKAGEGAISRKPVGGEDVTWI